MIEIGDIPMNEGVCTVEEVQVLPENRIRKSRIVPFGFTVDPSDPGTLIADPELYKHIDTVRKLRLSGASLNSCRDYLYAHTGRHFSRTDITRLIARSY